MLVPEYMALFIFFISSVFGLINVIQIFQNQPISLLILLCHCFSGIVALGILWFQVYQGEAGDLLVYSAIIFSIAGALDALTLSLDLCKKKLPRILAVIHSAIATIALILLIVYVLK